MSRHATARTRRILLGPGIIAAILLFLSSATWRDDFELKQSNFRGIPLQILPDTTLVEACRSIGYVSALTSQAPLHSLFSRMIDQEMNPTLEYLRAEVERVARLTAEAFHTPSSAAFYERVLMDGESRRLYHGIVVRQMRVSEVLFGKKRPSATIGKMIEENIADLDHLGLADWAGYDYEMYANYWFSVDEDEKALDCLRKAFICYVANGDLPLASQSAEKLGRNLLRRGEWEESERTLLEGLRYANEAGDSVFASRSLYSLALLRASQGYVAGAESLLAQSVRRLGRIPDPTTGIRQLIGLAELYGGFGEYSRAGYLAERAILEIDRNLAEPAISQNENLRFNLRQHLAAAIAEQAAIQFGKKEYDAAIGTIRTALDIAGETRDDRLRASLLGRLGDVYAAERRPKDAVRCYSDALGIARRKRDRAAEAAYLGAIGRLNLDSGQFKKAEGSLARALDINPGRESWMQEAGLVHLMARAKVGLRDYGTARELCERSLALLFANVTENGFHSTGLAARGLVDSISSDLILLESDRFRDCDSLIFAAEKSRAFRGGVKGIERANLDDEIRRCIGRREWIPSNAVVIQHIVTPGKTIIIAMDRVGATYRSIPISRKELLDEVAAFAGAASLDKARSLYRVLLDPVSELLEGNDMLCLIPDESLQGLPFGALVLPGDEPRFLIEDKRLFYSPSLLVLRSGSAAPPIAHTRTNRYRPVVLVARSDISPLLRRLYPGLDSLPQTQGELAAIRRLIPYSKVLAGRKAEKDTVTARMQTAALIHIASHTVQYPVYGGSPALLLSSSESGCEGEHIGASLLTAEKIASMKLPEAMLAVISSCESGVGRYAERVQGYGIGGAFLEAGARDVVVTLRPVEDASAREFAIAFYGELLRGGTEPVNALWRAQNRMIAEDRSAGNPLRRINVWGPYILLGSFGPAH